jgi:lipoate-protein ligase B
VTEAEAAVGPGADANDGIRIVRLGRVDYAAATQLQEDAVRRRLAGGPDLLFLLEHPPVYTLGRGADPRFLGRALGGAVPVVRTARGGEVTYHGPGQLVGYPVVDLRGHRLDVHWYVRELEAVVIDALAACGVRAGRREGYVGVWVDGVRKIASIGVGIRRWVTWHGFAVNVTADLRPFEAITPCGIDGVQMTSVAAEGGPDDLIHVADAVVQAFMRRFRRPGRASEVDGS